MKKQARYVLMQKDGSLVIGNWSDLDKFNVLLCTKAVEDFVENGLYPKIEYRMVRND